MPTYKLNISIEIDEENENLAVIESKTLLSCLYAEYDEFQELTTKVALTRDGDRGGLNILLPKLSGRCGDHYQGRKCTISECLKKDS